jgi:hypothetical protein
LTRPDSCLKGARDTGEFSFFGVPSASSGQALRLRRSQSARTTPLRMTGIFYTSETPS